MDNKTQSETPLRRESRSAGVLFPFLVVASVTGIATHLAPGHTYWQQWTDLLHVMSGIGLSLALPLYSVRHLRRIMGLRRPAVLVVGLATFALLIVLAGTGLHIILFGQLEALRWIYDWHLITGYGGALAVLVHLFAHVLAGDRRRRVPRGSRFPTTGHRTVISGSAAVAASALAVTTAMLLYGPEPPSTATGPAVTPYELPYGNHPFRPSQTETSDGGFFAARWVAGSDRCGTCHRQIYDEWRASLHSLSASDKSYVSNIELLEKNLGMAATRYCEGCHAPVALLSGELTTGGSHGGVAGTLANLEGVSCMGCHGINRAVHLKGVASYEFEPARNYLFADDDSLPGIRLHNFLIRIHPREHQEEMARPALNNSRMCATCHVAFMPESLNDWGWVKLLDEYSAWLNSQYSGQSGHTFANRQISRCQDCHMPLAPGVDPSADASGRIVSHRTLGANTAIPWLNGDHEQYLREKTFLQSGKLYLAIDRPWRSDASQSTRFVDEHIRPRSETPAYFYLEETARLQVTVTNARVGHDFPGGTTDINEAWLAFRVVDAENRPIYESGALQLDNGVDEAAHFYRSVPVDRRGDPVWRHDLFNMVGDSYRKTIAAGDSDVVEYAFNIPSWAKSPLVATAVLRYRKFNNRYARWALDDPDINPPIIDLARDAITLPLRIRPEIRSDPG